MPAPAPDPGRSHLVVGLTGGIASGKSTVARRLAELGAAVVDADVLAREVVAPGSAGLAEVADAFPCVLAPDGSLDRAALGRIVFADPAALRRLEAVTHPRIAALRARREVEAVAAGARVVVQDVPLLVEKGLADEVDLVLVVHAPEAERIARLVRDRAMTEADARARVAAQATDEQRRAVADLWLDNTGTPADLVAAVDELWARPIVTELGRRGS